MNTKHTPGPWEYDPINPAILADQGKLKIATLGRLPLLKHESDWLTERANARLIAASPDLLAALESLYAMGEHQRTIANGKLVGNTYAKAREAIAKAKGE